MLSSGLFGQGHEDTHTLFKNANSIITPTLLSVAVIKFPERSGGGQLIGSTLAHNCRLQSMIAVVSWQKEPKQLVTSCQQSRAERHRCTRAHLLASAQLNSATLSRMIFLCVLCLWDCVSACCMHLVLMEVKRGHQIPWNHSYRWL